MPAIVMSLLPEAAQDLLGPPAAEQPRDERWDLGVIEGRFVEISGEGASAALTSAFGLVVDAQERGENVAWVSARSDGFYPPDAAAGGVDLGALPVVIAPGLGVAGRAVTHLLRSGAFGLLVLDLGGDADVPSPLQSRLAGLAQHHGTALLCLTEKPSEAPSIGSLVSLRAEARREVAPDGTFRCSLTVLKDKRRGPGANFIEVCHGPAGLR
ncbi:MAG: recombinase A [Deltaproteobacteria bacterium HGW-Deltaproteobacteria-14]|nr:MAG: recombinase A [Deltaproteobacteria bacterium HGW-Deltaproteobacteria-14]